MDRARVNKIFLLISLCCLQTYTLGSKVVLSATPQDVKESLTSSLVIHCALNDTAASSAIIGRRDVTQTTENVVEVTSFIVMKNGKDVASMSHTKPAHVMDGSSNIRVTGSVAGTPGERGFLQLEIDHPGKNQTGEYVCEANAVTDSGHTVTFSTTTEVTSSSPTTADLIAYVTHIREDLNKCCRDQKPEVFFSAAVTTHLDISTGVVVFDKVFSNKGSSYDNHSGLFTCSVSGYYRFDLNALAYIQTQFYLYLQQNNQNVIAVFARDGPGNQGGSSNSAIIHLSAGDVMRVVTNGHSKMYGTANDAFVTLSGELISVD